MFGKLFGKKVQSKEQVVMAPLSGTLRQLEEVPDPVFAGKMVGEGIAIEPSEGIVVAPFDGEIVQLFPTKHAIGLRNASGLEVLIHIGLDTVSLQGEGFEAFVKQGDQVKMGDKLITFDMAIINDKASSTITPVVLTNGDVVKSFDISKETTVIAGQSIVMTVYLN
ncbi:PTS sugar transporter subunit IIA [Sporosarcina sp. FSL K6-3457]|uniref:PTS sugar transporter subunit IIA n=1 Tax=Sporosarcina sp. FSL K6-3457 TaxID=2978204 RepID=UPI0030F8C39D